MTDKSLEKIELTDQKSKLMIAALGLTKSPKGKRPKECIRNSACVPDDSPEHLIWQSLVSRGFAEVDNTSRPLGWFFAVTPSGMNQLGSDILKRIPQYAKNPRSAYNTPLDVEEKRIAVEIRGQAQKLANRIFERDEFACVYCGTKENLSLDHVHPVSRGGDNSFDNLVTACRSCNSSKGAKHLEDWIAR